MFLAVSLTRCYKVVTKTWEWWLNIEIICGNGQRFCESLEEIKDDLYYEKLFQGVGVGRRQVFFSETLKPGNYK